MQVPYPSFVDESAQVVEHVRRSNRYNGKEKHLLSKAEGLKFLLGSKQTMGKVNKKSYQEC